MNEREWGWKARDSKRVFAREWSPDEGRQVNAVVALAHGMGEHSGRYRHVAQALTDEGIAVFAFDQLGHGRTEGKRGHASSYDRLLEGFDRLLAEAQRRYPDIPVFLYGHSMGGNLTLNYVLRRNAKIVGAIVTSPWLKLAFEPQAIQVVAARFMERVYPKYANNHPLEPTHLTADPEMLTRLRNDELGHSQITAKFFLGVHRAARYALKHADRLRVPLLLMQGDDDKVTSVEATRQFAAKAGQLCTLCIWPGLRHELHNEIEREEVLKVIIQWLQAQLKAYTDK